MTSDHARTTSTPRSVALDLEVVGLSEMLHVDTPSPAAVKAYFEGDRKRIMLHLHRLATGAAPMPQICVEPVRRSLRTGLLHLAAKAARAEERRRAARRPGQGPASSSRSCPPSTTLDGGAWAQDVS
jgi:hypothetical protein